MTQPPRTPAKRKARELAKHLRGERPDYAYLKDVFRHLRAELDVEVQRKPKTLPYVPTEEEIRRYYHVVWTARRGGDIILIKTLLYTAFASPSSFGSASTKSTSTLAASVSPKAKAAVLR